jgi:hypothetical protein
MALFIRGITQEFHLQNGNFFHMRNICKNVPTTEIQADGHELEFILKNFNNIPTCPARVQTWGGDFGSFILKHLGWIQS